MNCHPTAMNPVQPQQNPLSDADLELLSAYIDNELSVPERVQLEQRLRSEPALRRELEDLQATTALLRNLEPVRPPRSFTLDPATAPRRRMAWLPLNWVMQFGSSFAGLVLVIYASLALFTTPVQMTFSEVNSGLAGAGMAAPMAPAATEAPAMIFESAPAPAAAPADDTMMRSEMADDLPPNAGGPPEIDATADALVSQAAPLDAPAQADAALNPPAPDRTPAVLLVIGLLLLSIGAASFVAQRRQI